MKFSIITVVLNNKDTIKDAVHSVAAQTYRNFEHIIVDGGSTDGTRAVIASHAHPLMKVISEPDEGIYDAMNKGLAHASGDVILFLNADDFYTSLDVLTKLSRVFENPTVEACYSDLQYVDRNNTKKIVRLWRAGGYNSRKLTYGWIPPHPTFFARSSVYKRLGGFRKEFKIAGDYELMLRFLKVGLVQPLYIPEFFVTMREGGHSAKNWRQRVRGWKEIKRAWQVNSLKPFSLLIAARICSKFGQYFV